jgi:hypothetical protein
VKANRTAASNSRASPSASKSFFLSAFQNARLAILRIFVAEIRQGDSLAILRLWGTLTASLCNIDHWRGFRSYGSIRVSTPMTRPPQSFARRWRKNDPWPQSCWIMKRRTRMPCRDHDLERAARAMRLAVAGERQGSEVGCGMSTGRLLIHLQTSDRLAPSGAQPCLSAASGPLRSDLPKQHQHDNDDQYRAEDAAATVTVAIAVAAEASAETAEQEDDEKDDEDGSE